MKTLDSNGTALPLLDSLIAAILKSRGDGLVMHVGERPYVLTMAGPAVLSDRPMGLDAMNNVLADLLSVEDGFTLREIGSVEKDVTVASAPGEVFRLLASRSRDDIWVEFKRQRPAGQQEPEPAPEPYVPAYLRQVLAGPTSVPSAPQAPVLPAPATQPPVAAPPPGAPQPAPAVAEAAVAAAVQPPPAPAAPPTAPATTAAPYYTPPPPFLRSSAEAATGSVASGSQAAAVPAGPRAPESSRVPEPPVRPAPAYAPRETQPAVVLPLARSPIRGAEPGRPAPTPPMRHLGVGRLLRTAAARGASSLYLMSEARPAIRVDDEMIPLESEPPLSIPEVEALVLELAPSGSREALAGGSNPEWVCELPDVGRVRCLSFRDQRGPGAVFRLIPARLATADQLGLSRDIQALCGERDGLILVAGPRLSGKSTLVSAFVDLINRNRSDYVISLETEIKFVHENRKAMVSQREVRGDLASTAASVRAALRENPDVLVVDDLRNAELVSIALEAADSGHLVIASITAHTTMTAIARLIESVAPDRQMHMSLALSEALRGAVAQVLLRKTGGGRVAARELLLNTPSVATLLAEGKVGQLAFAIDSGRKYGMVPMNDALAAFVQSGAVDPREAYRKAYDRVAFLEQLRRDGIDTSFVERLA